MSKRTIQIGNPELPAAGYKRDEELSRRQDALDETAETLAAEQGIEALNPDIEPEPEILHQYDMLNVTKQQPDKAYCWVNTGLNQLHIKRKIVDGWELVQGDMLEAVELKGVNGDSCRRLGDVVLMRIDLGRKMMLDKQADSRKRLREEGILGAVMEKNDEIGRPGLVTVGPLTGSRLAEAEKRAGGRRLAAMSQNTQLRARR